jgi:hypothetical protein
MKIIYTNTEGTVSVVHPAPEVLDQENGIERVIKRSVPEGVPYQIVEDKDIPIDRTFRMAWKEVQGKIDVDMSKAMEIHMEKIRAARDKVLSETDVEITKALEAGDTPTINRLRGERQKLRDIPQTFDLSTATTPEELKVLWPSEIQTDRLK